MPQTAVFTGMSTEVVKRFLQTVVVVDDEAEFPSRRSSHRKATSPARGAPVDEMPRMKKKLRRRKSPNGRTVPITWTQRR